MVHTTYVLCMTHTTHKKGTALEMSLGLLLWGHFNEFKTAWKLLQLYKGEEEKETLYEKRERKGLRATFAGAATS